RTQRAHPRRALPGPHPRRGRADHGSARLDHRRSGRSRQGPHVPPGQRPVGDLRGGAAGVRRGRRPPLAGAGTALHRDVLRRAAGRAACRARPGGGHVTPVLPTVPARPVAPGDSAGAEERTCHPRGEGRSNLRHPREECLRPRGGVPLPWPTFDTARAAALREMREDVSMSKHSTHATRTLKTSPLRRGLARTAVTLAGGAVVATGMIATGTAANAAGGWDE